MQGLNAQKRGKCILLPALLCCSLSAVLLLAHAEQASAPSNASHTLKIDLMPFLSWPEEDGHTGTPAEAPDKSSRKNKPKPGVKPTVNMPQTAMPEPATLTPSSKTPHAASIPVARPKEQPGFWERVFGKHGQPALPVALTPAQQQMQASAMRHYHQANRYGQDGRVQEAIASYNEAIALYPEFADAYAGLSVAYAVQSDWRQVLENAQTALQLRHLMMDPSNLQRARFQLSTAHCAAGDYYESRRIYRELQRDGHPYAPELWRFIETNCQP